MDQPSAPTCSTPPPGAPSSPATLDEGDLRRALERAGWRYTRQRAAVFGYLRSVDCHPTAEQVFAAVRQQVPAISLATVYKALEALVDARLAARVADPNGPMRYDGRAEAHYHLRCEQTGQLRDLPLPYDAGLLDRLSPSLAEELRRQGFEVTGHRLEVVGHFRAGPCPEGREAPPAEDGADGLMGLA